MFYLNVIHPSDHSHLCLLKCPSFSFLTGHVSVPCNIILYTQLLYRLPFIITNPYARFRLECLASAACWESQHGISSAARWESQCGIPSALGMPGHRCTLAMRTNHMPGLRCARTNHMRSNRQTTKLSYYYNIDILTGKQWYQLPVFFPSNQILASTAALT